MAGRRVTPATVFTTGSITKQFTGAAVLKLEMLGKLAVEDKISDYFDNVPADKRDITIHHLLTHAAGFPGAIGDDFGDDTRDSFLQQALATESGHWPLIRYNPALRQADKNPFVLDSPRPRIPLRDYVYNELRYTMLKRTNPESAERMLVLAQEVVNQKWEVYEEMAIRSGRHFHPDATMIE